MTHLLSDVYKVDLHWQISNLMNSEAIGWFTPLELAAIGTLFEGMQAHATNAIAEVVQGLVVFEKVLHDMVVSMQENHLGKRSANKICSILLPCCFQKYLVIQISIAPRLWNSCIQYLPGKSTWLPSTVAPFSTHRTQFAKLEKKNNIITLKLLPQKQKSRLSKQVCYNGW